MKRSCYSPERYFAWNGVVLLVVGAILLLDRLGIVPLSEILRFWPVLLVAAGTVLLVQVASLVGRTVGGVLLAGGLLLQAANLGFLPVRGGAFWPLALIGIGVILIGRAIEERNRPPAPPRLEPPADRPDFADRFWTGAGKFRAGAERFARNRPSVPPEPEPADHPDFSDRFWAGAEKFRAGAERFAHNLEATNGEHVAVFSHVQHRVTDQNLERLKVVAVFGGAQLDLRSAGIRGDQAYLEADAVFGGVEIVVPEDWQVNPRGAGVFGGFTDETQPPANPTKQLIVTGAGVFGGVVITNAPGFWNRHHMKHRERRWQNRDWQNKGWHYKD
jgi:Domain of unknown function (DUF5668)/Cell wall-active antibiotics response 4TMS YvqF